MATKTLIAEEEYLRTSFEHDPEYRDGELVERSMPTFKHGKTQGLLFAAFLSLCSRFPLHPCVETRIRVRSGRYLIPDVAVFYGPEPLDVPDTPPLIAIEILSRDDVMSEVMNKLGEYHAWGVTYIWLVCPKSRWMYAYDGDGGIRKVSSLKVPELNFEPQPADVFGE
jgi:Uma2 family endonuclease